MRGSSAPIGPSARREPVFDCLQGPLGPGEVCGFVKAGGDADYADADLVGGEDVERGVADGDEVVPVQLAAGGFDA